MWTCPVTVKPWLNRSLCRITGRRQLQEGMAFTPGNTVIVDQGEKLSLKETLSAAEGDAERRGFPG
ncbi:hypothetical protein DFY84_24150 [Escherichia coli]|nr:hypothetical protein [Escherichia coli]